jgi:hypothetical protein
MGLSKTAPFLLNDRYGILMATALVYVFPPLVMLAETIADPVGPLPVKVVTAFPFPSVVADRTDKEPLVVANVTVTPPTAVPRLFFTFAVTTLLEVAIAKVEGTALTVMLNVAVADPILVITAVLDMLPTAA